MASIGFPQPQQPHDRRPTTTYEAPLHPDIRSIVSLTKTHTQKLYFSGPLIHKFHRNPDGDEPRKDQGWRDVWAQLCGTTLSIWDTEEAKRASQQGKEVLPLCVDVKEAVRSPFCLYYLRDSTKPSSSVCPCPRYHNTTFDTDVLSSQIHQCHHSQHYWNRSSLFLLLFQAGPRFVGYCLPAFVLGNITPRGDLYGPSHQRCHEGRQKRWRGFRLNTYSW